MADQSESNAELARSSDALSAYGVEESGERGDKAVVFRYQTPDLRRRKGVIPLASSDILFSAVQVIREGGENNLHAHTAMDGFWFVLSGSARFYGEGDELIAELGRHEGVFIPREVSYWFESVGDELLELLQVEAYAKDVDSERVDYAPRREATRDFQLFAPDGKVLAEQGPAQEV